MQLVVYEKQAAAKHADYTIHAGNHRALKYCFSAQYFSIPVAIPEIKRITLSLIDSKSKIVKSLAHTLKLSSPCARELRFFLTFLKLIDRQIRNSEFYVYHR